MDNTSTPPLEATLLGFQHLASAIKTHMDHLEAGSDDRRRRCGMLLRLALDGALRAKSVSEAQLLGGGGEADGHDLASSSDEEEDEGRDLCDTLRLLTKRFRAVDPEYDEAAAAPSFAEQRRHILARDLSIMWHRHCAAARVLNADPGRLRAYLPCPSCGSEDIAGAGEKRGSGVPGFEWAPPQGHTAFSWQAAVGLAKRRCPPSHSPFSWPPPTCDSASAFCSRTDAGRLLRVVAHVRSIEATTSFLRSLLEGQREMASQLNVDCETFAYGSTPFSSWLRIFEGGGSGRSDGVGCGDVHPLRTMTRRCRYDFDSATGEERRLYVVFGSALGLLAFYGSVGLGLCTVGYEILPCLARRANEVAQRFGVAHRSRLQLVEGDMLEADLSNAGVVLLTSQCWDRQLIRRVHNKLARELPRDALVVDYTPALASFQWEPEASGDGEMLSPGCPCHFVELTTSIVTAVSWNASQRMYVYQKQLLR